MAGHIGCGICEVLTEEVRASGRPLRLVLHGSLISPALESLATGLSGPLVEARAFAADLTDTDATAAMVGAVTGWAGRLDCLISNAGQSCPGKLDSLSDAEWQQALDLRVIWVLARAAHAALGESRGNIVAVASMSGLSSHPGYGAYFTAKAGLVMLCRQLAQEWAGQALKTVTIALAGLNLHPVWLTP